MRWLGDWCSSNAPNLFRKNSVQNLVGILPSLTDVLHGFSLSPQANARILPWLKNNHFYQILPNSSIILSLGPISSFEWWSCRSVAYLNHRFAIWPLEQGYSTDTESIIKYTKRTKLWNKHQQNCQVDFPILIPILCNKLLKGRSQQQ
jgi:hypothetical protein